MPKETYEIFLSSTSIDLKEYRDKVREFVKRLGLTDISMETFGARPNTPLETCKLQVEECDALIVIVGKRYGWVPTSLEGGKDSKSITWLEVTWALEAGIPVYAFLCDLEADLPLKSEQDRLLEAKTQKEFVEIGNAVRHLLEFRAFLESKTTLATFSSVDDLAAKVTTSLQSWFIKIAEERAKKYYKGETSIAASALNASNAAGGGTLIHNYEQLYWQEQIHLTSAKCLLPSYTDDEMGIAIIAGKADLNHPALAEMTNIRHFDMRENKGPQPPDDYTTALASMLVGNANDGTNFKGILPNAKLSLFQVLSNEYSTAHSTLLAAIEAAIVEGNKVLCLTLGSIEYSEAYKRILAHAYKAGVVTVCAAGNNSSKQPFYPAAFPFCISVGAVGAQNQLAEFSNFGEWVTTAAPGKDLPVAKTGHGYMKMAGTTFSCAIVSGAVALMLQANKSITAEQIRKILKATGKPLYNQSNERMSFMQIDVFQAVQRAIRLNNGETADNGHQAVLPVKKEQKVSRSKKEKKV